MYIWYPSKLLFKFSIKKAFIVITNIEKFKERMTVQIVKRWIVFFFVSDQQNQSWLKSVLYQEDYPLTIKAQALVKKHVTSTRLEREKSWARWDSTGNL